MKKKSFTADHAKILFSDFEYINLTGIRVKSKNKKTDLIVEMNNKLNEMGFEDIEIASFRTSKSGGCPGGAKPVPIYKNGKVIGFKCT